MNAGFYPQPVVESTGDMSVIDLRRRVDRGQRPNDAVAMSHASGPRSQQGEEAPTSHRGATAETKPNRPGGPARS
jgi:hypothetical protein